VEPWLGLPDAIHHGTGLRMLAAGKEETASCEITVAKTFTD
jgi:aldose 1-epimerase